MITETQVPLQTYNTFGIAARAERLLRLRSDADVQALLADPVLSREPHFILGEVATLSLLATSNAWSSRWSLKVGN